MEKQVKKENVKVKIYAQDGNIGDISICALNDVETELKRLSIGEEDSMYGENSIYGIQIVFSTEKYISDYIANSDVFKMNYEEFKYFMEDKYLREDLIAILTGYKTFEYQRPVNEIIVFSDIVWLHQVDDDTPSAYDEYRDLGWDFIIKNK